MSATPEKTLTLEITEREACVLVKWHASQVKLIAKKFGEAVLKVSAQSVFGSPREIAALKKVCDEEIQKHSLRAKGIISLLK